MITSPQVSAARTEYVLKLIIVCIIILVLVTLLPILAVKTSQDMVAHNRLRPQPVPELPVKSNSIPKHVQRKLEFLEKIFGNPEVRINITVPKNLRTSYRKIAMLD